MAVGVVASSSSCIVCLPQAAVAARLRQRERFRHGSSLSKGRQLCLRIVLPVRLRRGAEFAKKSGRMTASASSDKDVVTTEDVLGLPAGKKREYPLPGSIDESIDQEISIEYSDDQEGVVYAMHVARQACRQAIENGKTRLQLEIILPLIGATDLDDWPGGIQQQYKAGAPLVSSLLKGLVEGPDSRKEDGGCRKYIIDDSDAVGGWESDKVATVLFPTPETLDSVEALASVDGRPLLLINPQWQPGQVVSDFGFGARKKAREDLVKSFEVAYFLKRSRILGEDVCILRRYPGDWQVFVLDNAGGNECVAVEMQQPSYKQLQQVLRSRKGSKAGQGWFERLIGEFKFNQESLKNEDN